MVERSERYGISEEVDGKIQGKYDLDLEREILDWIQSYVFDAGLTSVTGADNVHEKLKDGIILCKLINSLLPNSVPKINSSKMSFKQMENIGNFLKAVEVYGVARSDMFQTVDLYENQNMPQVISCMHAIRRKAGSKGGTVIRSREPSSFVENRNFGRQ